MNFNTKLIHAGITPDPLAGAIMTPIYQTSTYVQDSPGNHKGFEYARTQNPTRDVLQKNVAALEGAKHGIAFSSGMGATDAILKLLKPGDEIVSSNDLYGGAYRIMTAVFEKYGIKSHFVDMRNLDNVAEKINPNTRLLWVETPTNPLLNIVDIAGISALSKQNNLMLCVDNTFATPYLQQPIKMGADIVVHSATKYLGGHSDAVLGIAVCKDDKIAEDLAFIQNSCGAVPGPQDCFLILRGIKTLHVRIQRHCENGQKVAEFLAVHPKVDKLYWPGFESHFNHEIAKAQMDGFGGMVSFSLKGNSLEDAMKVLSKTKYFACAESLGGVESLIGHPASMTHGSIPKAERDKTGIVDSLIRLSVGIEDIKDLIGDLEQALS